MLDLISLCKARRVDYRTEGHHHCTTGWAQTHCPRCSAGSGFRLGFNLRSGAFACWHCGKLSIWDVLPRLLQCSEGEARSLVARYQTQGAHKRERKAKRNVPDLPPGTGELQKPHLAYLRSRGFDENTIRTWGLQATAHLSGQWAWRVIIPVLDRTNAMCGYLGRAIRDDVEPKYRSTHSLRGVLYGEHLANTSQQVVIVEGPADVWALGPGAVSLIGVAWSQEQAAKLARYRQRLICLDPDRAGRRRAEKLAAWLAPYGNTEIVDDLPDDPGNMSAKQLAQLKTLLGTT